MTKTRLLSREEFREFELNAPADERWELIDGRIVKSVAGGTLRHNKIVLNVATLLRRDLLAKGSSCETFTENVRLDPVDIEISTLPDVVVTCNPPSDEQSYLTDATAIIEVLSPSTASTDLNEKLSAYLKLPSLRQCVFIEQSSMSVVFYTPSTEAWLRRQLTSPDDILTFDVFDISMTLAQIYDRVELQRRSG